MLEEMSIELPRVVTISRSSVWMECKWCQVDLLNLSEFSLKSPFS